MNDEVVEGMMRCEDVPHSLNDVGVLVAMVRATKTMEDEMVL